jgi:oligo-1,6-glucosidase
MRNVTYPRIEDYADAELIGLYHERLAHGGTPEATLAQLAPWSRDNARTPVQWDTTHAAGFTTGVPWLSVNPNYPDVNRARQVADPHSVLRYYQRLIALRRERPVLVYGTYEPLVPDEHALYAYVRRSSDDALLIIINTCGTPFTPGEELRAGVAAAGSVGALITGNTPSPAAAWDAEYGPWEARLYELDPHAPQ